jgi:hypothetical protein
LDRAELTLVIAGALVAALLLGWAIGAIGARLNAGGGPAADARDLVERLARSEAARQAAEAALAQERAARTGSDPAA